MFYYYVNVNYFSFLSSVYVQCLNRSLPYSFLRPKTCLRDVNNMCVNVQCNVLTRICKICWNAAASIKYFLPKICTKEIGYGNAYYSCLNPDVETVNPDFGFEFGAKNPDLTPDLKSGFEALITV